VGGGGYLDGNQVQAHQLSCALLRPNLGTQTGFNLLLFCSHLIWADVNKLHTLWATSRILRTTKSKLCEPHFATCCRLRTHDHSPQNVFLSLQVWN